MKNLFICILLLPFTLSGMGGTLSKLAQHASLLDEYPKNKSDNWESPDFNALYSSLAPHVFNQLFKRKRPIVRQLKNLLKEATTARTKKRLEKEHIVRLVIPPQSKVFVWGDISGGFHSLIRMLSYLKEKNYLNNALKITQPDCFFVFNGNSISRGPYNIETLITLLLLLKRNPNRVFYLKGEHERNQYWTNFNFRHELKYRAQSYYAPPIPLKKEITHFFDTLPSGLFITTPGSKEQFIRISPSGRQKTIINEGAIARPLLQPTQDVITPLALKDPEQKKSDILAPVVAIIKSEDWLKHHYAQEGLAHIDQDVGATGWVVLSSPIEAHQKLIGFSYDAFALLTIADPLAKSTLTLFNRKADSAESLKPVITYNIQTGTPTDITGKNGITDYLLIGSSMALVQGVAIMGQRTKRGMNVRLNKENKQGGINNTLVRSIVYNDNYTPHMTRSNINTLLNRDKTDIVLLPVGSPTLASYLDYIRDNKLIVLFPITGGPQFRDPTLKGIVHFRGTYADEVRALVDYMVTEGASSKFAFFYQDDAYGKGPLEAAHEELRKKGISNWIDVPYQRNSVHFKKQADIIKEGQPDAIGFFSTAQATREVIRQIGIEFLTNKLLFGISFLGEESFRRFIKKHGLKVLFGAVVPNPHTSNLEIVKEYRAEMDTYNYPYDIFSLEAYIATSILLDIMKQITPPITKEKIIEKLEQLNQYPFKGLTLTFNPQRRDLSTYIWLQSEEEQEWIPKAIHKEEEPMAAHSGPPSEPIPEKSPSFN